MSITKNRFVILLIALFCALPLVLGFGACNDNTANPEPSKEENAQNIYQNLKESFLEFYNYRADISCQYSYRHEDSRGSGTSVTDKAGALNMQLHATDGAIYYCVQADQGDAQIQGAYIGDAVYKYGDTTDMYSPYLLDEETIIGPLLYYFVQNSFVDFVGATQTTKVENLTTTNEDGKLKVVLSVDVKDFATQLLDNFAENKDEQILAVLDELIKDAFGKTISTQALVHGFCADYTSTTTVQDLADYINRALGLNLSNAFEYWFSFVAYTNGVDTPNGALNTPLCQITQDDIDNTTLEQNIMDKLGDANLTLGSILDGTYDSGDDIVNDLLESFANIANDIFDLYDDANTPVARDMNLVWTIVVDGQGNFDSIQVKLSGNLGATNAQNQFVINTAVDCTIDVRFSQIGTTAVNMPSAIDNAQFAFNVSLGGIEPTAAEYIIDMTDFQALGADLELLANASVVAAYDNTAKTFAVQTQYLRDVFADGNNKVELSTTVSGGTYKFILNLQD